MYRGVRSLPVWLAILVGSFLIHGCAFETIAYAAPPCPEIRPPEAQIHYVDGDHVDVTLQVYNSAVDRSGGVPDLELNEWDHQRQQWKRVEKVKRQPVSAYLRVLIIPDIAPGLLVIQPGQVRDPAPYLAIVFEQLLRLFNFSGETQTDTGVVAIPGRGREAPSGHEEKLYNTLVSAFQYLATRDVSKLPAPDLIKEWLEEKSDERRVVIVLRWQPEGLHTDEYPVSQAHKLGVRLFILDLDSRTDEGIINRLNNLYECEILQFTRPEPWPGRWEDNSEIVQYVKRSIARIEPHIESLREACVLSFSSQMLLDGKQMDPEVPNVSRRTIVQVRQGSCVAEAKGRIEVQRGRAGGPLLWIICLMAIVTNASLIFMLALLISDRRVQGFLKLFGLSVFGRVREGDEDDG